MQKSSWNITEFRGLIKNHLSQDKIEKLNSSLKAIIWKINICKYHVEEYRETMKQTFSDDLPPVVQAVGKVLHQAARTTEGKLFDEACFKAEAHIISFAQSLHSIADILAHVLLYSFKLDSSIKNERDINLYKVCDMLKRGDIEPRMVEKLENCQFSNEFRYLNGFVNVAKHRSLVPSNYSVDFFKEQYDIQIQGFDYNEKNYPIKWAHDFTARDFEQLLHLIQQISITLNEHLRNENICNT
jgi:hypothetical protein